MVSISTGGCHIWQVGEAAAVPHGVAINETHRRRFADWGYEDERRTQAEVIQGARRRAPHAGGGADGAAAGVSGMCSELSRLANRCASLT